MTNKRPVFEIHIRGQHLKIFANGMVEDLKSPLGDEPFVVVNRMPKFLREIEQEARLSP